MHTLDQIKAELARLLAATEAFVATDTAQTLHAKPTEKWSIAEELKHLAKSNQGCAHAFGQPADHLPKTTHPPRNYEALVAEYKRKYAAGLSLPTLLVAPGETQGLDSGQAADHFAKVSRGLLQSLDSWQEAELDAVTVWKHPLLGPVTAREMMLFTVFHNRHHGTSMQHKHETATAGTSS